MYNDSLSKIADVFRSNLGNRITVELANGIIQEIQKYIPKDSDVNNTTTDSSTKE